MRKDTTFEKPNARQDVWQRIMAGARRHFFAHGFRGVTMDDLAKELGMSKKTVYAHFPSKQALLEGMIEVKFAQLAGDLREAIGGNERNFSERFHGLLFCMRDHAEEVRPSFIRDVAREMPDLFEFVRTRRRQIIHECFSVLLREGKKAGMIRRDADDAFLIEYLCGAADAVVNPEKLAEFGLTPREAFTEVVHIFLQGIATEKGRLQL